MVSRMTLILLRRQAGMPRPDVMCGVKLNWLTAAEAELRAVKAFALEEQKPETEVA